MKTAVSIPDPMFERAEKLAARLGISRSRLYQRAIGSYLTERVGSLPPRQMSALESGLRLVFSL